jgi:hypothetical protein
MKIGTRSMNWNPRPSAWKEMQMRAQRNKQYRAENEGVRSATSSMLVSLSTDQSTRAGDIAAKRALARIQAETAAKVAENQKAAELDASREVVWKNKPATTSVTAGNARINLEAGTVTMSNGTTINVKTGLPAGNIMTLGDGSQIDLSTGQKVIRTA